MDDKAIITLYHNRDEAAIIETQIKYGSFCKRIAMNILQVAEDAEECVNDTYHAAWNRMPPEFPSSLSAFLGRITRNISISKFRANRAKKRYNGIELLLSELEECIPSPVKTEDALDAKELTTYISRWLNSLPSDDSALFVQRYWYGQSVQDLAGKIPCSPGKMAQRMLKLRKSLKNFLEKEGITI